MPITAVLFDAPPPTLAIEPLRVGGLTALERQTRQARRAGAAVIVVAPSGALVLPSDATNDILVIEPGVVLDDRIVRVVAAAPAPAVAIWPAATAAGTERIDVASSAAGIGLYPAAMVRAVAAGLGDWDLASTLCRAALAAGAARIDLMASATGNEPLTWARPENAAAATAATAMLIEAARTTRHDAPGRWLNTPVAARVTAWLLATPVTSAMATLAVAALAVGAIVAFALGALWMGLLFALAAGMLDGVDRGLARVRLDRAWLGLRLRPAIAVVDYGWFAAIGSHFAAVSRSGGPLAVAALIIGFALADRVQDRFFRRLTGTALAGTGTAEWYLRLLGAARDTRLWLWLPFAVAGAWYAGFVALAAFTAVTFFVAQRRIFVRLDRRQRDSGSAK